MPPPPSPANSKRLKLDDEEKRAPSPPPPPAPEPSDAPIPDNCNGENFFLNMPDTLLRHLFCFFKAMEILRGLGMGSKGLYKRFAKLDFLMKRVTLNLSGKRYNFFNFKCPQCSFQVEHDVIYSKHYREEKKFFCALCVQRVNSLQSHPSNNNLLSLKDSLYNPNIRRSDFINAFYHLAFSPRCYSHVIVDVMSLMPLNEYLSVLDDTRLARLVDSLHRKFNYFKHFYNDAKLDSFDEDDDLFDLMGACLCIQECRCGKKSVRVFQIIYFLLSRTWTQVSLVSSELRYFPRFCFTGLTFMYLFPNILHLNFCIYERQFSDKCLLNEAESLERYPLICNDVGEIYRQTLIYPEFNYISNDNIRENTLARFGKLFVAQSKILQRLEISILDKSTPEFIVLLLQRSEQSLHTLVITECLFEDVSTDYFVSVFGDTSLNESMSRGLFLNMFTLCENLTHLEIGMLDFLLLLKDLCNSEPDHDERFHSVVFPTRAYDLCDCPFFMEPDGENLVHYCGDNDDLRGKYLRACKNIFQHLQVLVFAYYPCVPSLSSSYSILNPRAKTYNSMYASRSTFYGEMAQQYFPPFIMTHSKLECMLNLMPSMHTREMCHILNMRQIHCNFSKLSIPSSFVLYNLINAAVNNESLEQQQQQRMAIGDILLMRMRFKNLRLLRPLYCCRSNFNHQMCNRFMHEDDYGCFILKQIKFLYYGILEIDDGAFARYSPELVTNNDYQNINFGLFCTFGHFMAPAVFSLCSQLKTEEAWWWSRRNEPTSAADDDDDLQFDPNKFEAKAWPPQFL